MKISLAMTTYNGESYLKEQLESIRLQSVVPDEVIICDDRSTDHTPEIIKNYIEKHNLQDSWFFIINEKNKGYANNFYDTARMCSGDIILFSDQDDVWRLNKVEIMKSCFMDNPNVDVLYGEYRDYDTNKENPKPTYTDNDSCFCEKVKINRKSMYLQTIGCVMAIRKDFWCYAEKYWYPGFAHDEYAWKIGLCKGKLYHINKILIDRRVHGNNVSKKKMRNLQARIDYVEGLKISYQTMLQCMTDSRKAKSKDFRLIEHNIKGCDIRLRVLNKKQIWLVPLLFLRYADIVITTRSFLVEAYYGLMG